MFMTDHDWILITISLSNYQVSWIKITISLYKLLQVQKNPAKQNRVKLLSETAHQYIFKRSIIQPLFFYTRLHLFCFSYQRVC